ncbi:hypothetical protein [Rugamonas sp. DEMB1]|uniref:hypothetical protein n=1 Tax=Rugamonas sp. DEMB1 TaxID=3039386 RepID=UPI00244D4D9B|nr:hypothetical protein [Rugamonas sp. DEMB1]WGG50132.1 hypothetical protein QC826_27420 [Rugamonas sp. DEMB1]
MLRKLVLPEPEGPGDGDEFAGLHLDLEAAQGVRLDHVGAVDFAQVVHAQHGLPFGSGGMG